MSSSKKKSTNVAVDPAGDAILVLDGIEIQVSSKVLGLASKVFRAMFSLHFAEGNQVHRSGKVPTRIALMDDDPKAMTTVCNILHYQIHNVKYKQNLEELENLAVVIDKYDCVDTLRTWTDIWLRKFTEKEPNPIFGRLLHPTYMLDNAEAFQKITEAIVVEIDEDIDPKLSQTWFENNALFPDGLLETLESSKANIKTQVQIELEKVFKELAFGGSCTPDCGQDHTKNLIKELHWAEMWPLATKIQEMTISEFFEGFESALDVSEAWECGSDDGSGYGAKYDKELFAEYDPDLDIDNILCDSARVYLQTMLPKVKKQSVKDFQGLCLDCVRRGRQKKKGDHCRVTHK